jgi:hypothetical protein
MYGALRHLGHGQAAGHMLARLCDNRAAWGPPAAGGRLGVGRLIVGTCDEALRDFPEAAADLRACMGVLYGPDDAAAKELWAKVKPLAQEAIG